MWAVKSLKHFTLMGPFCQNHIKFQLKKYSDAKFKEKLTCGFTHDMGNFVNFHPTTQKSENFTSMGSFCAKYIRFELMTIEWEGSCLVQPTPHFEICIPFLKRKKTKIMNNWGKPKWKWLALCPTRRKTHKHKYSC